MEKNCVPEVNIKVDTCIMLKDLDVSNLWGRGEREREKTLVKR